MQKQAYSDVWGGGTIFAFSSARGGSVALTVIEWVLAHQRLKN